ncbi:MAG TPA: pyridoxal phosphate-dependent aminotransferase [Caulobacteraceae bacterium]|nr:pyridoxal phosphate-dependent aminotransferase [Caulobacteraceae bacterium]
MSPPAAAVAGEPAPLALTGALAPKALDGVQEHILRIPLENISSLAKGGFGDPSIIPLWFGEGDRPAPAFIGEALKQAIDDGHVFYTSQNGIPELRQALADYLTGLNAHAVAPERITVTFSGMNAIMLCLQLVMRPGDNIVVIDPVWPNVAGMARLLDAEVRSVRMDHGPEGWTLDVDRVAAALDERTRVVFFASPGNPTGAMLPMETQASLLDLCRRHGVWLMADEVYNRIVYGVRSAPSILDHADPEDRLFVVNSFSKSWAMTGWRLGWIVHPPSVGPILAMQTQYTTSGVTTFLQHAGVAAIRQGEPFVASMRDYCEEGMGIVCDALERFGRVRLGPRPKAGMYAFFEVDGMPDSRKACLDILEKTRVGLAPGYFFNSDTFLRLCVCRAPDSLAEAMGRLETVLG